MRFAEHPKAVECGRNCPVYKAGIVKRRMLVDIVNIVVSLSTGKCAHRFVWHIKLCDLRSAASFKTMRL